MVWEQTVQTKFNLFISKMPIFHRGITQEAVTKQAEQNAVSRRSNQVEEQDVVAAFFSDVPAAFYSMMIRLLEQTGFDYRKYGYPNQGRSLTPGRILPKKDSSATA